MIVIYKETNYQQQKIKEWVFQGGTGYPRHCTSDRSKHKICSYHRADQSNRYLFVMQYYFTKWATAVADQTATRIVQELVQLFSEFGVPKIVHSDQGCNFESMILRQTTLEAFGVRKSYHPHGYRWNV